MNGAQVSIRGREVNRRKAESAERKTPRRKALRPGLCEGIQTLGWGGVTPGSEEFDVPQNRAQRDSSRFEPPGWGGLTPGSEEFDVEYERKNHPPDQRKTPKA